MNLQIRKIWSLLVDNLLVGIARQLDGRYFTTNTGKHFRQWYIMYKKISQGLAKLVRFIKRNRLEIVYIIDQNHLLTRETKAQL